MPPLGVARGRTRGPTATLRQGNGKAVITNIDDGMGNLHRWLMLKRTGRMAGVEREVT